ncbi:hypothetical protein VMCG_06313 [Cytospora schulzeri]|uniref:Uncharacterized protein n=1 Tax=Cytospora schulzeri TaxID=448051 RepID=A0A423W849_9PEZI|nr:hypothetical protein VMCG_06313 [Valsa malicola]
MLTTTSQITPRARSLQTQYAVATRAIGVSSAARIRQPQHIRRFRLGMWFSHFDPDLHREIQRRQRHYKHKYGGQMHRQLSWDKQTFADDARHVLRRMMKSSCISHDARSGSSHANDVGDDKQRTPANKDGVRPGQNIEDVERGAMDHLLFGKDEDQKVCDPQARRKQKARSAKSVFVPHSSYGNLERDDFVIDPITNRKVAKHPAPNTPKDGVDIPVKTIKDKEVARFGDLQPPYEDLDTYRTVVVDEITARFVEDEKAPYSDLDKYKPVMDDATPSKQDTQPRYNDLSTYKAFGHNEPDGKPDPTTEPSMDYDPAELARYGPVEWNEPDGNPSSTTDSRVAEGLTKDYDPEELARYGTVRWNEPDGKPAPFADPKVAEGLSRVYTHDEILEYSKTVQWNDPYGNPLPCEAEPFTEGPTKEYPDLDEYSHAYRWNEPDGKPTSPADPRAAEELTKIYTDLDKYNGAYRWNEPDGKPAPTAEELSKNYTDLGDYSRAYEWNEPDGNPSPTAEELRRNYTDLDKYGPVRYQEPDGQPAIQADPLQQSQGKMDTHDQKTDNIEKSNYRKMLDSLMKRHQTASDAIDREASLAVKSAKAKVQQDGATESPEPAMTGNYVRDFPEDFNKSWTETLSEVQTQTESQSMDGGLEGAFGQPSPSKIQTALDRVSTSGKAPVTKDNRKLDHTNSDLKEAQVLETREDEKYSDRPTASSQSDTSGEPTLYKILAYDPTMQEINIAETSSYVPDTASALTPGDALARLSNPAKFFPHFLPLELEGYEIVSGTGDILVFRKVRPSATKQAEGSPSEPQVAPTATESHASSEGPINPIDMTGRAKISPASANFASPTGYVNYENLPETEASNLPPPPPRIKYNIDVQREEPVFSGPKTRRFYDQKRKEKSLGKRLVVGGVWVASISYALGVISEYFTTGGVDGMGPKGL